MSAGGQLDKDRIARGICGFGAASFAARLAESNRQGYCADSQDQHRAEPPR